MNTKMAAMAVGILVAFVLSGCFQPIQPSSRTNTKLSTEQVYKKNYKIGESQAVFVGQPVLKVKSYKVDRISSEKMHASDDFVITGGPVTITGRKGDNYAIVGETTLGGETYTVVQVQGYKSALVKADGSVLNKILNGMPAQRVVMLYTFNISPTNLRFTPSDPEEKVVVGADGYLNYELIYGGTDGKSITFTYKEFTADDLARPAFYQNLVYEASKKQIRFKETLLNVQEASNEKIVFSVISDGLAK
jgi:hypothetical protein